MQSAAAVVLLRRRCLAVRLPFTGRSAHPMGLAAPFDNGSDAVPHPRFAAAYARANHRACLRSCRTAARIPAAAFPVARNRRLRCFPGGGHRCKDARAHRRFPVRCMSHRAIFVLLILVLTPVCSDRRLRRRVQSSTLTPPTSFGRNSARNGGLFSLLVWPRNARRHRKPRRETTARRPLPPMRLPPIEVLAPQSSTSS